MASLVEELMALTSKQKNLDAEHKAKVTDLQNRNSQTKEELIALYDQLQTLEDEQHEYFRHISELRRIGNEYPPHIREVRLSPPNEHTSCPAIDVATENAMAADSLLAELDKSYQFQERGQPTEAPSQRSVQVTTKSVAANLKTTKFYGKRVPYSYCFQFNDTGGYCRTPKCPYKHEIYNDDSVVEGGLSGDVIGTGSSNSSGNSRDNGNSSGNSNGRGDGYRNGNSNGHGHDNGKSNVKSNSKDSGKGNGSGNGYVNSIGSDNNTNGNGSSTKRSRSRSPFQPHPRACPAADPDTSAASTRADPPVGNRHKPIDAEAEWERSHVSTDRSDGRAASSTRVHAEKVQVRRRSRSCERSERRSRDRARRRSSSRERHRSESGARMDESAVHVKEPEKNLRHVPTEICHNYLKGVCYRGDLCSFIHVERESEYVRKN